jgi:hypothetical protein
MMQAATRFGHIFNQENVSLVSSDGTVREMPSSDLTLNGGALDKFYDDLLRGAMNQKINLNRYSDEVRV